MGNVNRVDERDATKCGLSNSWRVAALNTLRTTLKRITKFGLILLTGVSMSACSESWKEEVLLHDGSKLIVERLQTRGGGHEIGQSSPIKEYSIFFALPNSNNTIEWKGEYSELARRADPNPLALHVLNGIPYLVTEPVGCVAYNKWGRPNPPYVIFKYDGKAWQRITIQDLPIEFKDMNLVIETKGNADKLKAASLVTAEAVQKFNSSLRQSEYRAILRDPIKPHTSSSSVNCEELVLYKGSWILPNDPVARKIIDRRAK